MFASFLTCRSGHHSVLICGREGRNGSASLWAASEIDGHPWLATHPGWAGPAQWPRPPLRAAAPPVPRRPPARGRPCRPLQGMGRAAATGVPNASVWFLKKKSGQTQCVAQRIEMHPFLGSAAVRTEHLTARPFRSESEGARKSKTKCVAGKEKFLAGRREEFANACA